MVKRRKNRPNRNRGGPRPQQPSTQPASQVPRPHAAGHTQPQHPNHPPAFGEPRWGGERWVSLPELAERCGVCERTLRNWRDAGKFPIRRLGGPDTGRSFGMMESEFIAWMQGTLRWAFVEDQYYIETPTRDGFVTTTPSDGGGRNA